MKDFKAIFALCGMDEKNFSTYFKAFGDSTRQKILAHLSRGERTVSEIVAAVGFSQPTISRHLSILKSAGIVIDERRGKNVLYALNKELIRRCCMGFCSCLDIDHLTGGKKSAKNR